MSHGIDFTNFQHTLPGMGLLLVGVFHLLTVLITNGKKVAVEGLNALRAVAKNVRLTKAELRRAGKEGRRRAKRVPGASKGQRRVT